jgi:maintenance of morphology protein 1
MFFLRVALIRAEQAVITPPSPSSLAPALTLAVLPNFTLELQSRSLLGSRAKLADVPKLHELIDSQIRRAISRWGTLRISLPGLPHIEAQA